MMDYSGQVFGNYRLQRLLGRGGQSSVYLGQHIRLQQKQGAVKVLHAHLSSEAIKDFQKEADIITSLHHPHIVTIFDFDVQQDTPFLVMEYYPQGTLHQRHPRGTRVPLATTIGYVKQIASALQYAHDQRVVHRDIKPANMLIGLQGDIVLSDFGIAVAAHDTASLGAQPFAGTVPYMAPEQIKQYPRRESDQYALAVVVYEWLTGKLPFSGTAEEIAIKHMTVAPSPLRDLLPNLAPQVEQVVLKALAKEPKERFPTIQDFAQNLELAALNSRAAADGLWQQGGWSSLAGGSQSLANPVTVTGTSSPMTGPSNNPSPPPVNTSQEALASAATVRQAPVSQPGEGASPEASTTSPLIRGPVANLWQRWLAFTNKLPRSWVALTGIVLFSAYFALESKGIFLEVRNLLNILSQTAIIGLIAVGLTLTVIVGEVDLSVGMFANFAGILFAVLLALSGLPFPLAIAVTLLAGIGVGGLAGLMRMLLKIPVIITTFVYYFIFSNFALLILGGGAAPIALGDNAFQLGDGASIGITLAMLLLTYIVTHYTPFGRRLPLVGADSASLSRNKAMLTRIVVLAFSGILVATAGIVNTLWLSAALPDQGTSLTFTVLAALALSGNNLKGGQGSVLNTLAGVLCLMVLDNGLSLMGDTPVFQVVLEILDAVFLLRVILLFWQFREALKIRR